MILSSESLKMPFLNTSFESEAPITNYVWHLPLRVGEILVRLSSYRVWLQVPVVIARARERPRQKKGFNCFKILYYREAIRRDES